MRKKIFSMMRVEIRKQPIEWECDKVNQKIFFRDPSAFFFSEEMRK